MPLAAGLVELYACQAHRDHLARVFASLTPDPAAWTEAILRDTRPIATATLIGEMDWEAAR